MLKADSIYIMFSSRFFEGSYTGAVDLLYIVFYGCRDCALYFARIALVWLFLSGSFRILISFYSRAQFMFVVVTKAYHTVGKKGTRAERSLA